VARLASLPAGADPILAVLHDDLGQLPDASAYWRVIDELTDHPADAPGRTRLGAGDRLGEYRLLEELGEGGMGTVYRAVHARLERVVAVKVLRRGRWADPASLTRFGREMKAVGRLRHPNIVHATDAGEADGVPYLVMELIDGRNLARVVKEDGPLPLAEACEAVRQAAVGLQHAHEAGLVHRDVKPSNLIRTADGTVKLLDLGLAMMTSGPPDPEPGTPSSPTRADGSLTSRTVGTLEYMAPEQRRDPHQVDARADVYGLGCTLWFLLTGKPPRPGEVVGSGAYPGGLPAELWRKFLASDPADRFPTAADAAAALKPAVTPDRGRRLTRRTWLALTGGAAVVALTTAVAFLTRPPTSDTGTGDSGGRGPNAPAPGKLPMKPDEAKALQQRWADYLGRPVTTDGPLGMKFVLVPPGEHGLSPECRVRITRPYYIGTCEVTVGQFRAFVEARSPPHKTDAETSEEGGEILNLAATDTSSLHQSGRQFTWRTPGYPIVTDDRPVTQVGWRDADMFCRWLSETSGGVYRLPKEAEWSWASRAGSTDTRSHGASTKIQELAWARSNAGTPPQPQPVGRLKANPWGLYDNLGNVAEICQDLFGEPPAGTFDDYRGAAAHPTNSHTVQGSAYYSLAVHVTVRGRQPGPASYIGFRVVREIE
jgi:serine/threonine protein kinase/formylglycine-generating enzyme required for sulfatase activity